MADASVVHIGENSPEHVAYRLMHDIATVEDKLLATSERNPQKVATRQWILDTYAECLRVVRLPNQRPRSQ
ncbi:MAG TPA: hypothetical protein VIJ04_11210 [Xanthobacteraceae bacterium]